jgi:hypothetical protein
MNLVLKIVWACKVFLTGASAFKYCSESFLSPTCCVSAVYAIVIFGAVVYSYQNKTLLVAVNSQEDQYLRRLEEGLGETIILVKQNYGQVYSPIRPSQRQWEDPFKEKHS